MNKKLYKLMDWPAIEAIQYAEEDQPQKVLGAHVYQKSTLYQTYLPDAVKVDLVLEDEDKVEIPESYHDIIYVFGRHLDVFTTPP